MKFNNIPPGHFYMGSCQEIKQQDFKKKVTKCLNDIPNNISANKDEMPQHKVHITKGFQLGVYEVTYGQFKKYVVEENRTDLLTKKFIKNNRYDNAAVNNISWSDAQDFIDWLNVKESENSYRLPTEAEWEYSARAGASGLFYWGNSEAIAGNYGWYDENIKPPYPNFIGLKKPNSWGLYDVSGNVGEWVSDWYDEDFYQLTPENDPLGSAAGVSRVFRGGSWFGVLERMMLGSRDYASPTTKEAFIGFRVLRQKPSIKR